MGLGFFKDKTEKLMREIAKLEPEEFLGVCKILGIKLVNVEENVEENVEGGQPKKEAKPKDFIELWDEVCEKVNNLNKTQKRNLDKLVRAATKGKK
jgi:hypothetical protein